MAHRQEVMEGIQTLRFLTSIITDRYSFQSGHSSVQWPPPQSEGKKGVKTAIRRSYL